jgi:hypothetical protein
MLTGGEEESPTRYESTVPKADRAQAAVRSFQGLNALLTHRDAKSHQEMRPFIGERFTIGAEHEVFGPLAKQPCKQRSLLATAVDGDGSAAMLPSVAIRANVDAATEQRLETVDRWQLVNHAGRDQHGRGRDRGAVLESNGEVLFVAADGSDRSVRSHYGAICPQLLPRPLQQFRRCDTVLPHETMEGL